MYLYDERETVLRLQTECEGLKIRDFENRRRVQHLLALTQPVTHETTFFREGVSLGVGAAEGREAGAGAGGALRSGQEARAEGGDPSWSPAALEAARARAAAAEDRLAEAQLLLEERGEAWRREREQAEEEARAAREAGRAREAALEEALRRERAKARSTAEQLVSLRSAAQRRATSAAEEVTALGQALAQARAQGEQERSALERELAAVRAAAAEEARQLEREAGAAATARDADAASMRAEFDGVRRLYAEKLRAAETHGAELQRRMRRLQARRARDLEGFGADVTALRRALEQLETQWALVGETAAFLAARAGPDGGGRSGVALAVQEGERLARRAWGDEVVGSWEERYAGPGAEGADGGAPGAGSAGAGAGAGAGDQRSPLASQPRRGQVSAFRPTYAVSRAQGGRAMAASGLLRAEGTAGAVAAAAAAASGARVEQLRPAGIAAHPAAGQDPMTWSGISEGGPRTSPLAVGGSRASSVGSGAERDSAQRPADSRSRRAQRGMAASSKPAQLGARWEPSQIQASLRELGERTERLQRQVRAIP